MAATFTTWGGTHRCTPAEIRHVTTTDEVVALVRDARAAGRRIKPAGTGHSWSDAAVTDGCMVRLDGMDRLLSASSARVRVQGGMRLRTLCDALAERGLALPILGSIDAQTVAGAIATGTHGSSLVHGNLSSLVRGVRLVDGRGEIIDVDDRDPRLDALRVGLGALGIVTEVELDVVPAFGLREELIPLGVDDAIRTAEQLARDEEYVKLWWLPHTETALVFRYRRSDDPSQFSERSRWFDERIVNGWVFPALLAAGRTFPTLVPWLNGAVGMAYFRPRTTAGRSDRILTVAMPPVHREAEEAVPVERTGDAIRAVKSLIDEAGLLVDFVVEVRFVRRDTGWLSPAYGRDSCQVGAYMAGRDANRYFTGFQQRLRAMGSRPHWGKEFTATRDAIEGMYPRYQDFRRVAGELDPDRTFRNAFVDRLLG
jgi:FAD/FMN-containing dehydrogenase